MRAVVLEVTGLPSQPVRALDVAVTEALDAAEAPPYPMATLRDPVGALVRVEGRRGQLVVEMRRIVGARVEWVALGEKPPSETMTSLHGVGRIRKVRGSELLSREAAAELLTAFLKQEPVPERFAPRPLSGEDGGLVVLAGSERDPRPVGAWHEVERFIALLPGESAVAFALSRPERSLIGVLGDGRQFGARLRETRGASVLERSVRREEVDPSPARLALDGAPGFRADELFDRGELLVVLESLYRFEDLPPGYRLGHANA